MELYLKQRFPAGSVQSSSGLCERLGQLGKYVSLKFSLPTQ